MLITHSLVRAVKPAKVPEARIVSGGLLNDLQDRKINDSLRLKCLRSTHKCTIWPLKEGSSLFTAATTSLMDRWKQPTRNSPFLCGLQTHKGEGRLKLAGQLSS